MLARLAGIAGLAAALTACGGQSVSDSNSGGSGGASVGGSGGASVGGSGGASQGGSGGTSLGGSGGTSLGGSGGSSEGGSGGAQCSGEIKQKANLGGPAVGFESLPGTPGPVAVVQVSPYEMELSPGLDAGTFKFAWVGPDLTQRFKQGEMVTVGSSDGWDYVMGEAYIATARREFDFVAPDQIPEMPGFGPHLGYAPQCSFLESSGGCNQPPASVTVLALEATTGAGVVTIPLSATEKFMAWEITNVNNIQFPGYGNESCVVEAGFVGIITAIGPSPDMAQ